MTAASVSFEAPDGIVRITRDARGVPFVRAGGFAGLFEGQGYATACDRLWHIEHDRRRARGTLAAVTGLAQHAQYDVFARRVRFVDLARAGFEQLDPDARAACTALATGVNRRLADSAPLSAPFLRIGAPRPRPMEPWEPLAVFLARHATFATWQHKLWNARVAATLGAAAVAHFSRESRSGSVPVIVPAGVREANSHLIARCLDDPTPWIDELAALGLDPGADAGRGLGLNGSTGSNAWAVHARRSATGGALVAGDPHRAFEVPNVYYQIGLALRDEAVEAAGFSFPGVPGVGHFAQTLTTAWAVTNAMADYQDLFIERLDEAVVDRRRETVEVRGAAALEVECLVTRHGPVVSDPGGTGAIGLALASTGFLRPGGSLAAVVPQLRARTIDELDACLQLWVEPVNNFVFADTSGAIAYRTAGHIPIRTAVNHWLPVPGWTAAHDWHAMVPHEALPNVANPSIGAVVTANQRVATTDYPHVIGVHPAGPNRANRIWHRLDTEPALDAAAMARIHTDAVSSFATRMAAAVPDVFAGWSGAMRADSVQAAVFAVARHHLAIDVAARLPASVRTNPFGSWEPRATANTPAMWVADALEAWVDDDNRWLLHDGETWTDLIIAAVHEAVAEVDGRSWGELHHYQPLRLGATDRLDLGPIDGAHNCVMATNDIADASLHALTGSTCRYAWDLADRSRSRWVVPMGSDEDDSSPHHADQLPAYLAGEGFAVWPPASDAPGSPARPGG